MSLKEYIKKRDFKQTAEPKGGRINKTSGNRFVIQKHAASHLHYDFRLEIDGTLKSWAVPKGVPFAKGEKRLAVQVEDHPLSYINFEGTIPQGQYGGGTVMVWDLGTFEALSESPAKELAGGKLHFVLKGKKLQGEWYLVRLKDGKQWLLIKARSALKPVSKKMDDTSALSGQSMAELAKGRHVWQSNGKSHTPPPRTNAAKPPTAKKPSRPVKFIEPMKARLVETAPSGDWIYEIKFDGFRALAFKTADSVRLFSRNEKDFGDKFPEIRDAVAELDVTDAIIDGEIVALDPKGRSSFQLLQGYELGEMHPPLFFYAFDLLRLEGNDLMDMPLGERKSKLEKLLKSAPPGIRYSNSLGSDAEALLPKVRRLGLEGLIGKRKDSAYEPGRRNGAWIKLKLHQEQEMVIGGYTEPTGSRQHFGALLIGYHEKNKLKFAGKVGTGFNGARLDALHSGFEKIASQECPFANLPEKTKARYGQSITASEMKRCHWVEPKLVCQVKFSEWTNGGKLRQPVFLGLREDKDAREVIREKAQ